MKQSRTLRSVSVREEWTTHNHFVLADIKELRRDSLSMVTGFDKKYAKNMRIGTRLIPVCVYAKMGLQAAAKFPDFAQVRKSY